MYSFDLSIGNVISKSFLYIITCMAIQLIIDGFILLFFLCNILFIYVYLRNKEKQQTLRFIVSIQYDASF